MIRLMISVAASCFMAMAPALGATSFIRGLESWAWEPGSYVLAIGVFQSDASTGREESSPDRGLVTFERVLAGEAPVGVALPFVCAWGDPGYLVEHPPARGSKYLVLCRKRDDGLRVASSTAFALFPGGPLAPIGDIPDDAIKTMSRAIAIATLGPTVEKVRALRDVLSNGTLPAGLVLAELGDLAQTNAALADSVRGIVEPMRLDASLTPSLRFAADKAWVCTGNSETRASPERIALLDELIRTEGLDARERETIKIERDQALAEAAHRRSTAP